MNNVLIFGGVLLDRYYFIDKYPERSQDGFITGSFEKVGGCSVNMAKTIQNLGGEAYVVSLVGNDSWGNNILNYMIEQKLSIECIEQIQGETGYCLVLVEPDGERTFLTFKGCEGEFRASSVSEMITQKCIVAAVTGYYLLDSSADILIKLLRRLSKQGYIVLFDPSPLVDRIEINLLKDMLEIAHYILPNEREAGYIAGINDLSNHQAKPGDDLDAVIENWAYNLNKQGKTIIVKRGAHGGTIYRNQEISHYAAVKAKAIDTTGAGDSFTGALAFSLSKGISLEKGVNLASACAAAVTAIKGPHGDFTINDLPMDIRKEIDY